MHITSGARVRSALSSPKRLERRPGLYRLMLRLSRRCAWRGACRCRVHERRRAGREACEENEGTGAMS